MCFIVQLPAISGNPFATSDNGYFVPRSPGTAPWNCIQARAAQLWFWLPPWSFIRPPFSLTTWPHGMFIWTFQSKGLRAPLSCTKLSCIWSTDCWIIGTALGANVKEPAKAKSAVPTGRKAGLARVPLCMGWWYAWTLGGAGPVLLWMAVAQHFHAGARHMVRWPWRSELPSLFSCKIIIRMPTSQGC